MTSAGLQQSGRLTQYYLKYCSALLISNADHIDQFSTFQQQFVHSLINKTFLSLVLEIQLKESS